MFLHDRLDTFSTISFYKNLLKRHTCGKKLIQAKTIDGYETLKFCEAIGSTKYVLIISFVL